MIIIAATVIVVVTVTVIVVGIVIVIALVFVTIRKNRYLLGTCVYCAIKFD